MRIFTRILGSHDFSAPIRVQIGEREGIKSSGVMPCRAQSSGGTHAKNIALRSLDYGRHSLRVFKISVREDLLFKFYKGILLAASVFLLKISMRSSAVPIIDTQGSLAAFSYLKFALNFTLAFAFLNDKFVKTINLTKHLFLRLACKIAVLFTIIRN